MDRNVESICQTCLQSTVNLKCMRKEDGYLLQKLLQKPEYNDKPNICILCHHMLRKISKFIRQCDLAQQYLQVGLEEHLKSAEVELVYNLKISATTTDYLGADNASVKDECNSEDDLPLTFDNDDDFEDATYERDSVSDNIDKHRVGEFENNSELEKCDDDISNKDAKDESEKLFHKKSPKRRNKKTKDNIPSGFSSRMVRETDEYTVIKLTKEQVLEEMRQNKETNDKYKEALYKCEQCVKYFNFEDVLLGHMEKHSPKNGSFKCEICSQYCPSAVSLRGHMKSHTTKYKCKICSIVRLSRQHILEHYLLEHTEHMPNYKCNQCAFSTNKRTVIQRHARTHTESKYTCEQCGRAFKSKETLRVHYTRHDVKKRFSCDGCKRSFIFKSLLHKHIRSVHIDKDFYCVECDTRFTSMEALKQHFKRSKKHTDPENYKYECAICKEKFLTKARLAHHETSAHNLPKTFQCAQCARVYSGSDALRLHVRRAHQGESKTEYHCGVCYKVFTRKSGVKVHMRVHTGERPYACECGDAFTQLASLRAHTHAKHKK